MSALGVLFVSGFRRWATYRMAAAAGAFTNTVFGLIRAYITVAAIGAAGGTLAGYDAGAGITYAFLAQAVIGPVNMFGWTELADRVRSGDIAVDLARPVDPQLAFLAADLGPAAYTLIPRGGPPLLVGALVFGLAMPSTPLPYVLGVISLVLAVCVSFALRWLANLASFWLLDVRGVMMLYVLTSGLLSGHLVPVHWFPDWLATLAYATPIPSIVQTPIDVVTGRIQGVDALAAIGTQALWFIAALVLGRWVFARGAQAGGAGWLTRSRNGGVPIANFSDRESARRRRTAAHSPSTCSAAWRSAWSSSPRSTSSSATSTRLAASTSPASR